VKPDVSRILPRVALRDITPRKLKICRGCGVEYLGTPMQKMCPRCSPAIRYRGQAEEGRVAQ
jgi:hypothetical protein